MGLRNCHVFKRFTAQIILWSLEFGIPTESMKSQMKVIANRGLTSSGNSLQFTCNTDLQIKQWNCNTVSVFVSSYPLGCFAGYVLCIGPPGRWAVFLGVSFGKP